MVEPIVARAYEDVNREPVVSWARSTIKEIHNYTLMLLQKMPWVKSENTKSLYSELNET